MKKIFSTILVFIMLAFFVIASTIMVSRSKHATLPIERNVNEISVHDVATAEETFATSTPDMNVGNKVIYENMKVTNKGLTAELREIDLNPDFPTVTICIEVPTLGDWLPRFSGTYNGNEVRWWAYEWIGPGDSAYQAKYRCYRVSLSRSTAPKSFSGRFVFSLDYFETSLPEQIPEFLIALAKERLKEKGIIFEVQNTTRGWDIIVLNKPDAYTQAEAEQMVREAMTEKFEGPWTFVIDFDQK